MNSSVFTKIYHGNSERKAIRRITWIGLLCNVALSTIKSVTGLLAGSQALVADGIHSLSDITTDIAILLGERFWLAPADKNHPYGHRRIEAMITVLISALLAAAAVGIGYDALATLQRQDTGAPDWFAFAVAMISIVIKEILFRFTRAVGRAIRSSAVQANALHHRSDAFSSIPVALAVLVAILKPEWAFVDHAGALVVSFFILYSAWQIARPALGELSDSGANEATRQRIRELVLQIDGVRDCHALRTRRNGPGLIVDLHVLVDPELSVRTGHEIAVNVRRQLLDDGPSILDVLVHIEPYGDPLSEEDNEL
jgi:cation diffusion facilitator family transporter